jgi:uncharacterized membrane protein
MNRKKVTVSAVAWLILLAVTLIFKVPIGNLGYLNVCDFVIMTVCMYMEPGAGMLYASTATALADIILGYGYFAPYTFVIRGLQGWFIGYLAKRKVRRTYIIIIAEVIMLLGYGITYMVMYGSLQVMCAGILQNMIQTALSAVLTAVCAPSAVKLKEQIFEFDQQE